MSSITYQRFGGTADALAYTYDNAGNIATISENGVLKASYRYDQFGQLVREDNAWAGKTYIYVYDAGGNLTQCREAAYTTGGIAAYTGGSTYSYATGTEEDGVTPVWKDLLTSYNGNTITYDAIGNPLNWGTSITNMTWNNGRRLTSLKNGASVIQYGYDESGLRTRKYTGTYTVYDRDASGIWYTKPGTTEPTIYTITMMLMEASVPSVTTGSGTLSARTSRGMSSPSWIPMAMWWRSVPMTLGVKFSLSPTPVAMPSPALFTLPMSTPSGIGDTTTTPRPAGIISIPGIMIRR